MTVRIAISGKMGSGKTTLATALRNKYPDVHHLSFASPIKEIVESIGIDKHEDPYTYRNACQQIGQRVRDIDPDIWLDQLTYVVECVDNEHWSGSANIVVDDVRYKNELRRLKERLGFLTVRLEPPAHILQERRDERLYFDHESELDLDNVPPNQWDLYVIGSPSVEEIVEAIDKIIG